MRGVWVPTDGASKMCCHWQQSGGTSGSARIYVDRCMVTSSNVNYSSTYHSPMYWQDDDGSYYMPLQWGSFPDLTERGSTVFPVPSVSDIMDSTLLLEITQQDFKDSGFGGYHNERLYRYKKGISPQGDWGAAQGDVTSQLYGGDGVYSLYGTWNFAASNVYRDGPSTNYSWVDGTTRGILAQGDNFETTKLNIAVPEYDLLFLLCDGEFPNGDFGPLLMPQLQEGHLSVTYGYSGSNEVYSNVYNVLQSNHYYDILIPSSLPYNGNNTQTGSGQYNGVNTWGLPCNNGWDMADTSWPSYLFSTGTYRCPYVMTAIYNSEGLSADYTFDNMVQCGLLPTWRDYTATPMSSSIALPYGGGSLNTYVGEGYTVYGPWYGWQLCGSGGYPIFRRWGDMYSLTYTYSGTNAIITGGITTMQNLGLYRNGYYILPKLQLTGFKYKQIPLNERWA